MGSSRGITQRIFTLQTFGLLVFLLQSCREGGLQRLPGHVPDIVRTLTPVGPLPDTTGIDLVIGLPLRDTQALDSLMHDLYQEGSSRYQQYLSPEQYTERFAPTPGAYDSLLTFARTNGLTIVVTSPNRRAVHVRAPAAIVDKVFHVTLKQYRHPEEDRIFYAPDVEPSLNFSTPIRHITGLDNFRVPGRVSHHPLAADHGGANSQFAGGSGSGGSYTGKDFRAAYVPSVPLTGKGQVVGILEFAGYRASDITTYETTSGMAAVPLQNVYLNGYVGGNPNLESAADIELVVSMAPGLSKAVIYGASYGQAGVHDVLNEMANPTQGEPLPAQISTSYYFFYDQNVYDALKQLTVQGQALFVASGDFGSYNEVTGSGAFPPSDHPLVTSVGGTQLQTSSPGTGWVFETAVQFSGGGFSPWGADPQFAIPYYQLGMDFTAAQGSTTTRNAPDVAMVATNIRVFENGAWVYFAGTSASAPLWAGFWALVNEQAAYSGRPRLGFANPPLYFIAKGPAYTSSFHDITTGNNFNATNPTKYPAVPGFDLVTGWGSPNGPGLIDVLTRPSPCHRQPELCYGVFDPFWWLKCPACGLDVLINLGDDIRQVIVFESLGREVGTFQRLPRPVVHDGESFNYHITLKPREGIGYVLRAQPAPGHELRGSFKPVISFVQEK